MIGGRLSITRHTRRRHEMAYSIRPPSMPVQPFLSLFHYFVQVGQTNAESYRQLCDNCCEWTHLKCTSLGVTEYIALSNDPSSWFCVRRHSYMFPFNAHYRDWCSPPNGIIVNVVFGDLDLTCEGHTLRTLTSQKRCEFAKKIGL